MLKLLSYTLMINVLITIMYIASTETLSNGDKDSVTDETSEKSAGKN